MEQELFKIFCEANKKFLTIDNENIINNTNERNLCGRLAIHLHETVTNSKFKKYFVDQEYNRNLNGRVKTILDDNYKVIVINCDLIVHSRGYDTELDNLIAIEMKKSSRPYLEKIDDKDRLRALTKDSYDDIWAADGVTLPEHVCRYVWGIYIELDLQKREETIELFQKGKFIKSIIIDF